MSSSYLLHGYSRCRLITRQLRVAGGAEAGNLASFALLDGLEVESGRVDRQERCRPGGYGPRVRHQFS